MAMFLVCLVLLTLLAIHTAYLLSNIMRGACYGTTYVSLLVNSFFIILKCARSIPEVRSEL